MLLPAHNPQQQKIKLYLILLLLIMLVINIANNKELNKQQSIENTTLQTEIFPFTSIFKKEHSKNETGIFLQSLISELQENNLITSKIRQCLEQYHFNLEKVIKEELSFWESQNIQNNIRNIQECFETTENIFNAKQNQIQQELEHQNWDNVQPFQHIINSQQIITDQKFQTFQENTQLGPEQNSSQASMMNKASLLSNQITPSYQNIQEKTIPDNHHENRVLWTISLQDQVVSVGKTLVYELPVDYGYTNITAEDYYGFDFDGSRTFHFHPGYNETTRQIRISILVKWIGCDSTQWYNFILTIINSPAQFIPQLATLRIPINSTKIYSQSLPAIDPEGNTVSIRYGDCPDYLANCNDTTSFAANTTAYNVNSTSTLRYVLNDGAQDLIQSQTVEIYNLPPIISENNLNVSIEAGKSKFLKLPAVIDEKPQILSTTVTHQPPYTFVDLVLNMVFFQVPTEIPDSMEQLIISYNDQYNEPSLLNISVHFINNSPIFKGVINITSIQVGSKTVIPLPEFEDPENNPITKNIQQCSFCSFIYDASIPSHYGIQVIVPYTYGNQTTEVKVSLNDGYYTTTLTFNLTIINEPPQDYGDFDIAEAIPVNTTKAIDFIGVYQNDPEGNNVTFILNECPDFVHIVNESIQIAPSYMEQPGPILCTYSLSEGYHTIVRNISFTVKNDSPYFIEEFSNKTIEVQVGKTGQLVLPQSLDPENNTNRIMLPSSITNFIQFDQIRQVFSFSPPFSEGPWQMNITFQLSDGYNEVPYSFTLKIINEAPHFAIPLKDQQIQAGYQGFYILPDIIDNEGNTSIEFQADAAFISYNETSNNMSYSPNPTEDAKFHIVTIFLNDGFHLIKHILILRVINEPPIFNGTIQKTVQVPIGSAYTYEIPPPIDPENNTMKNTIVGLPSWVDKLCNDDFCTKLKIKPPSLLKPSNYTVTINISDQVYNVSQNVTFMVTKAKPDFLKGLVDIYCNSELDCNTFQLPEMKDSQGNQITVTKIVSEANKAQLNGTQLIIAHDTPPGKYLIELTLSYSGYETVQSHYLYVIGPTLVYLKDHSLLAYGDQTYSLESYIPSNQTILSVSQLAGPKIQFSFNNSTRSFTFNFERMQLSKSYEPLRFKISTIEKNQSTNRTLSRYYYQNFTIQLPTQKVIETVQLLSMNISQGKVIFRFTQDQIMNKKIISDISNSDIRITIPSRQQKKPIIFKLIKYKEYIEIQINISSIKRNSSSQRGSLESLYITFLREFKYDDNVQNVFLIQKGFSFSVNAILSEVDDINERNDGNDSNEDDESSKKYYKNKIYVLGGIGLGLGEATKYVVGTGYTIFGTNMAGKVLGYYLVFHSNIHYSSFPLAKLWGMLNSLSYLTTLALIGTYVPEKQMSVLKSIFNFAQLDALSSDILLESFPGEEASIPYNDHFNQMGFGSRDLVANMQSAFFYLSAYLLLKLLQILLQKFLNGNLFSRLKCSTILRMLQKLDQNFFIRFFIQQYITIYISCILNLFVVNAEEVGHTFSTVTTFILFSLLIFIPFILAAVIYLKKNEVFTQEFQDSYGSAVEKLREDSFLALFWNVFLLTKYQITILILIFLVEIPYLQILLIQIMSIATLIYLVRVWPFNEKILNIQETVNEVLVILFCLCQYPLAFVQPQIPQEQTTNTTTAFNGTRILDYDVAEDEIQQSIEYKLSLTQEIGSWGLVGIVYFSALFGFGIIIKQMFQNKEDLKKKYNVNNFCGLLKVGWDKIKGWFEKNSDQQMNVIVDPESESPEQETARSGQLDISASSESYSNQADNNSLLPMFVTKDKQQKNLIESNQLNRTQEEISVMPCKNKIVRIFPLDETKHPEQSNLEQESNNQEPIGIDDSFIFQQDSLFLYKGVAMTERILTNRRVGSHQTSFINNTQFDVLTKKSQLYQQGTFVNENHSQNIFEEDKVKDQVYSEQLNITGTPPREQSVVSGITIDSNQQARNKVQQLFGTTPVGSLPHLSSIFFKLNQQSSSESLTNNDQKQEEISSSSSYSCSELPQKNIFITQMVEPPLNIEEEELVSINEDIPPLVSNNTNISFETECEETLEKEVNGPPQQLREITTNTASKKSDNKKRRKKGATIKKKQRRRLTGVAYKEGIKNLERAIKQLNQLPRRP